MVPTLRTEQGPATTLKTKAEAFKARFYPSVEADLSDIPDRLESPVDPGASQSHLLELTPDSFVRSVNISDSTNAEEVSQTLHRRPEHNTSGPDFISNGFLKAMGLSLAQTIAVITNASWALGHFPDQYKRARTIVIETAEGIIQEGQRMAANCSSEHHRKAN